MQRRELIKGGILTAGLIAISGGTIACGVKLTTWVTTIVGAIGELKPLLPNQAALLTSIAKVATDFDAAYRAGKFASAVTIFENLSNLIDQLIADVGVQPSQQVKVILAVVGIAVRTIAVLLRDQANQPAIAGIAAVNANNSAVQTVKRLSEPSGIDALYKAVRQ